MRLYLVYGEDEAYAERLPVDHRMFHILPSESL